MGPEILSLKTEKGIAGQYAINAMVRYPGEAVSRVSFVGSIYGGPIVMVTTGGAQVFVSSPERFGERLTLQWVRNFFASTEES